MSRIDILLATYNGAKYLPEQLASLSAQTHADWRLLVRDDGSSDRSLEIVRQWAEGVSQPVEVIEDGRTGLGAAGNFAALLDCSDAPYFAFCDQDDVWLNDKLAKMLRRVRDCEVTEGAERPLLAFCDLTVVDENLQQIARSFWHLSRLSMTRSTLSTEQVMVRNPVTGCATLGNAALRKLALPISEDARMHDWWLALTASVVGGLRPVPIPLILYRQHGGNTIGAMNSGAFSLLKRFASSPRASLERALLARDRSQKQARAFASSRDQASGSHRLMAEYGDLASQPLWRRKWFLLRHGLGIHSPFYFLALLTVV